MATKDSVQVLENGGDIEWTCPRFNVGELTFPEFLDFEIICDSFPTCAECLKEVT